MDQQINLPEFVPVMPLPGAVLFPHALLPLYIFEPRYQAMLESALSDQRMFCVPLVLSKGDWQSHHDFCNVAGLGLIRACVGRGDGTSNLILQGLQRVRFSAFQQETPFPIARIEPLESVASHSVQTEALGAKVLELYSKFKGGGREFPEKIDRYLTDLTDPETLADLMAATFVSDPMRRQHVLEELTVDDRLRFVIEYLRDESGHAAA